MDALGGQAARPYKIFNICKSCLELFTMNVVVVETFTQEAAHQATSSAQWVAAQSHDPSTMPVPHYMQGRLKCAKKLDITSHFIPG